MGIRDVIRKKEGLDVGPSDAETVRRLASGPEFTFIRSDTLTQDVIRPPDSHDAASSQDSSSKQRRNLDFFRSSRNRSPSVTSQGSRDGKSLSQRLHLSRNPPSSSNVPTDLPAIAPTQDDSVGSRGLGPEGREAQEASESQWEERATLLASDNERRRRRTPSPSFGIAAVASPPVQAMAGMNLSADSGPKDGKVSSQTIDADIQEAIRLHEEGDLENSTRLFGKLAAPNGANNPLSQVLYGLALRHGWGCTPDPGLAVQYLSRAAANAASVEEMALKAGLKKGGAAKGELVLAIFELANCFRHGWGIPKDAVAAKQYYETAANLGDTDAMNEAAWCYLEGFGCKKDKYAAARYYRLAEKNGNKTLGNSWIWKEKYDGSGKK